MGVTVGNAVLVGRGVSVGSGVNVGNGVLVGRLVGVAAWVAVLVGTAAVGEGGAEMVFVAMTVAFWVMLLLALMLALERFSEERVAVGCTGVEDASTSAAADEPGSLKASWVRPGHR